MTNARKMLRVIRDLAGATCALNNFSTSDDLTTETYPGLQWLARQIDHIVCDLDREWSAFYSSLSQETEPPTD